jgi:excisionase family DNA binding protein
VAGLADLLSADRAQCERMLPQLLRDTDVPGLSFISAGCPPLDPAALLTSPRMPDLLVMLSKQFDFVLFDSPPVLLAPDATILAMVAEGTLLVVSPGKASRKATRRSIDKLTSSEDTHLIGVALNRMPLSRYAYHYTHRKEVVPQQGSPAGLFHRLTNIMPSLPLIGRSANSDLASLSQAASMLGVHRKTVKRWCQEGRLPGVKKRLRWWVKQDGLESMVLSQVATKTSLDIQALDGIQSEAEDSSDGRSMSASPQQLEKVSGYETAQEASSEAVKT